MLGRGGCQGSALTRSQRGEVAALPWGFVKPIDCDRVPSFLWVCVCGGGGGGRNRYYFLFQRRGWGVGSDSSIQRKRRRRRKGKEPYSHWERGTARRESTSPSLLIQRWRKLNFLSGSRGASCWRWARAVSIQFLAHRIKIKHFMRSEKCVSSCYTWRWG